MDELLAAIGKNDLPGITRLLEAGHEVNIKDREGRTGLMYASLDGKTNAMQVLIAHRANLDLQDRGGNTALHFAAQDFRPEAVELLCRSGASVDLVDRYGNTPLGKAVMSSKGRGDVIKILLSHGADRNKKNKYNSSPLDAAKLIANYDIKQFFTEP